MTSSSTPVGLVNLGNTCYLNAALQVLLKLHRVGVVRLGQEREDDAGAGEDKPLKARRLLARLADAGAGLRHPEREALSPVSFVRFAQAELAFNVHEPNDAHEMFDTLVDLVDRAPFEGRQRDTLTCGACGLRSDGVQAFTSLAIDGQPNGDIGASLAAHFLTPERLDGYRCDRCGQAGNVVRRSLFDGLPGCLVVVFNDSSRRQCNGPPLPPPSLSLTLGLARYRCAALVYRRDCSHYYACVAADAATWFVADDHVVRAAVPQPPPGRDPVRFAVYLRAARAWTPRAALL